MYVHKKMVNLLTKDKALYIYIAKDNKYFFYFQNCLEILDGIYIFVNIPSFNKIAYQN